MGVKNKTAGAVNAQAPLDELALTLEQAFGAKANTNNAITLRTLAVKSEQSANLVEGLTDQLGKNRKVRVRWWDTCTPDVASCSTDLCDTATAGSMPNLNQVDLEVEKCKERVFYVDEDLFNKSKMSAMDYVQQQLDLSIRGLLRDANSDMITAIDAAIGVTFQGDASISLANYLTDVTNGMVTLYNHAQLAGMENAFVLNDTSWMGAFLQAQLGRNDQQGPFLASQLMDIAFDPMLSATATAPTHGYLLSPNAYAIGNVSYAPTTVTAWNGGGANGVEWFSLPTGVPGFTADVYVSRICKNGDQDLHVYKYLVKLRYDIFFNPSNCYFHDSIPDGSDGTDYVTGVISYGEEAQNGGQG